MLILLFQAKLQQQEENAHAYKAQIRLRSVLQLTLTFLGLIDRVARRGRLWGCRGFRSCDWNPDRRCLRGRLHQDGLPDDSGVGFLLGLVLLVHVLKVLLPEIDGSVLRKPRRKRFVGHNGTGISGRFRIVAGVVDLDVFAGSGARVSAKEVGIDVHLAALFAVAPEKEAIRLKSARNHKTLGVGSFRLKCEKASS